MEKIGKKEFEYLFHLTDCVFVKWRLNSKGLKISYKSTVPSNVNILTLEGIYSEGYLILGEGRLLEFHVSFDDLWMRMKEAGVYKFKIPNTKEWNKIVYDEHIKLDT